MKKKVLTLLLCMAMTAAMLAGCAKEESSPQKDGQAEEDPQDEEEAEVKDTKNMKVVAIFNTNLGDKAFSDSVWAGINKAADEYGFETKAVELMGDATKQIPTLTELSESGEWDVIVAGTFNMKEAIIEVAKEFPEQKYIIYDTELDYSAGDLNNCVSVMCKQNEGAFLGGALAALRTKEAGEYTNGENIVGFVGGGENSSVNDFLVGYIEGVKYIDPSCKVLFSYVGDFKNTAKAKELAIAQYQQGADIVFQVASSAGLGVLDAAKSENKLAIGVDQDQAILMEENDPEISKHIATSVVKKLDVLMYDKMVEYINGTINWGVQENAGISDGGMDITVNDYTNAIVSEDIINQISEIKEKIISGEIKVKSAMTMTTEELNQIKDSAAQEG